MGGSKVGRSEVERRWSFCTRKGSARAVEFGRVVAAAAAPLWRTSCAEEAKIRAAV